MVLALDLGGDGSLVGIARRPVGKVSAGTGASPAWTELLASAGTEQPSCAPRRLQLPVGRDTTSRSSDAIHVHLLVHLLTHLLVHPLIHLLASLLFHHHLPQLPSATVRGSRTNPNSSNIIFYPGTFNVGPLETYQGPLGTFNEPWQLCVCGNLS